MITGAAYSPAQPYNADLTWLYESTAGTEVLIILRQALMGRWPRRNLGSSGSHIELRSRLRSHLQQ